MFGFDAGSMPSSCLLPDSDVKKASQVNFLNFSACLLVDEYDPNVVTVWQANEAND